MAIEHTDDIPLPGELDAEEEESPFRRRQKAVAVRRGRVSRGARQALKWALFGVLVLLPVGYGGYRVASFALTSPRFMLSSTDDVVVRGNHYVPREEILSALAIPTNGAPGSAVNIFRLSLAEKQAQVEAIPWVRSATVTRAFPHRLAVEIVERVPMAFVNVGGELKLIDGEGALLEKPERADFDFPVLKGLAVAGGPADRRERLALYLKFTGELGDDAQNAGWMISEVDLSDTDDLRGLIVQGRETIVVHFGHENFRERFHNFLALLPEVRKTSAKIDSVDLRYRNQVVVNPVGPPPREAGNPGPGGTATGAGPAEENAGAQRE